MRVIRAQMLGEARALRAAFPDAGAMRALPVSAIPSPVGGESEAAAACRTALGHLRAEMLLVRAGAAADLTVLDDEIGCVERLPTG